MRLLTPLLLCLLAACSDGMVTDSGSDSSPMTDGAVDGAFVDGGIDAAPRRDSGPAPQGWCQTQDTVLGSLVSGMTARSWAELPSNDSLDQLTLHNHLVTWRDTAVWNPVARRVQWVGGPGSCCADPAAYKSLMYHVASDSWEGRDTPWGDDSGHAYDGNALDPTTGEHYFARGESVQSFDGNSWTPRRHSVAS